MLLKKIGIYKAIIIAANVICVTACTNKSVKHPYFTALTADKTGLHFSNELHPTEHFNLFSYMYYYNGAGTGTADFNNDGLTDIFFSANQEQNKLFINKGNLKFEDVTGKAKIPQDNSWSTGVSVVDINNDGWMDIYICKVGNFKSLKGKNQLLVCKGLSADSIPVYEDQAKDYGLDFSGFSTQAAFLDYDGDGDLDMFLLNHSINHDGNYAPRENFKNTFDSLAGQRLYRNDSKIINGRKLPFYNNVTKESGILGTKIGYGLGVVVSDINLDGWPDIYVGNDFHENDYLYINMKNGSFSEEGTHQLTHTSQFTMGVDAADINNDAFPDIISADMLPYSPEMLRRSLAEDDYSIYKQKIKFGYSYQYARNNLQYNNGNGKFTELGQYAGVHASDWSWSTLWTDFNNDGDKDLFISNGIPKRMNDIDYINFVSNEELQLKLKNNTLDQKELSLTDKFPEIKIPNQFYLNNKNFAFSNLQDSLEKNINTFSNSAAYADFDNDGDMDIVVNNIADEAILYQNHANEKANNYIQFKLEGDSLNKNAIGAKIVIFSNEKKYVVENTPVHGFQSSMQVPLHLGLGNAKVDSAYIIWPDQSYEAISIKLNNRIVLNYKQSKSGIRYNYFLLRNKRDSILWQDITDRSQLNYTHIENEVNEFNREQLLYKMNSSEGPALAVGDVNADGLEDVFIGASKTFHNALYTQNKNGTFSKTLQPAMYADSMWENVDAVITDINKDGFNDLVIASGGNEYYGTDPHLSPLIYINDGKGGMIKKTDAISSIYTTQSCIAANDFNNDGAMDLFIGSKTNPWAYGTIPKSYLLLNDGTGKFQNVTEIYCKELQLGGMVSSANWIDWNADSQMDLLVSYEWGKVVIYEKKGKSFSKKEISQSNGLWNNALPIELDNDNKTDIIALNIGLNTKLTANYKQPLHLYLNDFDDNGKTEPLLTYFIQNKEIPFSTKQELERQLPYLKKKYLYAADFSKTTVSELVGQKKLNKAQLLTVDNLYSSIITHDGKEIVLTWQAQLCNLKTAVVVDVNNDKFQDILVAGNYFENNVQLGRQDACNGMLLLNDGVGGFIVKSLDGLVLDGQIRKIKPIRIGNKICFIAVRNNGPLQVFMQN